MLNALRNLSSAVLFAGAAITSLLQPAWAGSIYIQDNLASDGFVPAANIDANLKNPWGIAFSPTSPFWVSDQGIGVSTLYSGAGVPSSLVVTIPGGSTPPTGPTGTVFNSGPAGAFAITAPAGATVKPTFLFDTLAGTIDGWNPGSSAGSASAEVAATQPGAVYTGLALDSSGSNFYLYAANTAGAGSIDVYDTNFNNVSGTTFSGKFADPGAIAGYVPFNVQNIGGDLYVEYASLTPLGAPLPGGYVDVFDSSENFLQRLATGGALEAPWGITLAPATGFGSFSGDLLIGNFGNGTINAFNPTTGAFQGTLDDSSGNPIVNSFLWSLDFGNGGAGFGSTTLYFTAGLNNQQDGLFGAITVTPEPTTSLLTAAGLLSIALAGLVRLAKRG